MLVLFHERQARLLLKTNNLKLQNVLLYLTNCTNIFCVVVQHSSPRLHYAQQNIHKVNLQTRISLITYTCIVTLGIYPPCHLAHILTGGPARVQLLGM